VLRRLLPVDARFGGVTPVEPEIVGKIQWLMLFRVAMITVLLGSTLIVNASSEEPFADAGSLALLGLIVGTYLLTIGYAILLPRLRDHTTFAFVQLLGDQMTTLALVLLTGGVESVFNFMLALTVMNGAILLFRKGAWAAAIVSVGLIVFIAARDWVLVPSSTATPAAVRALVQWGVTNVSAVLLVALLAGYLSELLQAAGQRLQSQSVDLEQLRTLNQHILSSLQSGLLSHTFDGRVIYFNQAAERITGLRADDVLFHDVRRVFGRLPMQSPERSADPSPVDTPSRDTGAALSRWEEVFERPDGQTRILGMSRSPLVDPDGTQHGAVIVFQDLTPLRQLEQQIRRSEKFAAIGKMAAGIAHEIRNPLASISGSIQMLQRTQAMDATNKRLMDIVTREIDRLNALITDFLKFARPAPPELARVRLAQLLQEVVEVFRYMQTQSEGGPRYDVDVQIGESIEVVVDPRQIKQVLWNLLNNAVEAMPQGGLVQVSGTAVGPAGAPDEVVELKISDPGVGIPAEHLGRIFDPFFTTKSKGSGLGLALVHRIVEEHGGQIDVTSEPDRGTTFTLRLPSVGRPPLPRQGSPSESLP
jgi:two-component system sensor histidine kinase PilS (NtrC family)